MMNEIDFRIMNNIRDDWELLEKDFHYLYIPIFCAHTGSYNYSLASENSDVDTICFIFPHLVKISF